MMSPEIVRVVAGLGGVLVLSSLAVAVARWRVSSPGVQATLDNVAQRLRSWWVMVGVFVIAVLTGGLGSVLLFGLTSLLALREYITLAPTHPRDNRAIFWMFFIVLPVQYALVYTHWYGMFAIFIPVYCFLLIPILSLFTGECEGFMQRTAVMQWGMMICVYSISHAPCLLSLRPIGWETHPACLLVFLVTLVEANDICQYLWGKSLGRRKIAPAISPNKTWAGFLGGVGSTALLGALLSFLTPMRFWQAAGMGALLAAMGFLGDLTMSAIKRDRGVKDFGAVIAGHGGILDRIDSLCFAAPVFFHLVRYYYV